MNILSSSEFSVLVVESDHQSRQRYKHFFRQIDANVEILTTAAQAYLKIQQGEQYDLVLCDVNYPNINGITLIIRCRQHPQYCELPIIIVGRYDDSCEIALQVGANAWLAKPVDFSQLAALIEQQRQCNEVIMKSAFLEKSTFDEVDEDDEQAEADCWHGHWERSA